ncbi:hypothetical protein OSB04_029641 [Centaurea solstitialis]|uniref:Protein kinase domain-containing protein n=1 Tax=Centaurea solstitialis TaxID=347529 RepID=A0AA38S6W4_9ASTR|nr:hypothetical protein OSB04_029641 [Centaurea solstitialis]
MTRWPSRCHRVYLEFVSGGSIHKLLQEYGPFREPITNYTSMLSFKGSPYWMAPEVAAIFKIGNSKDMPEIPNHLSNDAKSFIKQCLQRDPSLRPTASKLLDHPFVRDQATTRVANVSLPKEAFPSAFDGSRTPVASETHSNRNTRSFEGDYATRPFMLASKGAISSPRQHARTITSLPVSPTSSPLRQHGIAFKSGFLSPPHPSYAHIGQRSHTLTDVLAGPFRPNTKTALDPWYEIPQLRTQTPPNRSPR